MIECFEELIEDVQSQGFLPQDDLELTVCLFGVAPTPEQIHQDVLAYVVTLYNLGCTPGVSPAVVAEMLKPENRPDVLQGLPVDEIFGSDADENRELLVGELEGEAERLQAEADRLAREVDGPCLRAILERASILTEKAARRVARSHGEARTTLSSRLECPVADARAREGGRGLRSRSPATTTTRTRPVTQPVRSCRPGRGGVGSRPPRRDRTRGAPVSAVPVPACREEAQGSQFEPEDSAAALTQRVDESKGSVEGRPSATERQNGVFSPAPAVENTPSEARAERGGSEEEGIETSRGAQPAPEPVAAARCRPVGRRPRVPNWNPRIRRALWHKVLMIQQVRSRSGRRVRSDKTAFSARRRHWKTRPPRHQWRGLERRARRRPERRGPAPARVGQHGAAVGLPQGRQHFDGGRGAREEGIGPGRSFRGGTGRRAAARIGSTQSLDLHFVRHAQLPWSRTVRFELPPVTLAPGDATIPISFTGHPSGQPIMTMIPGIRGISVRSPGARKRSGHCLWGLAALGLQGSGSPMRRRRGCDCRWLFPLLIGAAGIGRDARCAGGPPPSRRR